MMWLGTPNLRSGAIKKRLDIAGNDSAEIRSPDHHWLLNIQKTEEVVAKSKFWWDYESAGALKDQASNDQEFCHRDYGDACKVGYDLM